MFKVDYKLNYFIFELISDRINCVFKTKGILIDNWNHAQCIMHKNESNIDKIDVTCTKLH